MIMLKTPVEIEYIRKSNRILAEVFEKIGPHVKAGVTTKELDTMIEDMIRSRGARPAFKGYSPGHGFSPYPAAACISVNEQVIHGIPGSYVLKEGDIVSIDLGSELSGYYGDTSQTFLVGKVDPKVRQLSEDTEEALYLGIDAAREGAYLNEIGKAIQFFLQPKGYGIVRDYCGHGVGKAIHEEPPILNYYDAKRKGPKLKKGMVIAIEPMVTLGTYQVRLLSDGWTVVTADKKPAAHWEHSIAITDGEPQILSRL